MRNEIPSRLWAAAVFAAAGMLLTAIWFFPVVRHRDDLAILALYIGLPGFAAAAAGALAAPFLGPSLGSGRAAARRGAATGLLALVLYAPMFAIGIKWSEPGWTSVAGLAALTLWFGLVAVGWAVALTGALAGWVVWRFGRG